MGEVVSLWSHCGGKQRQACEQSRTGCLGGQQRRVQDRQVGKSTVRWHKERRGANTGKAAVRAIAGWATSGNMQQRESKRNATART